MKKIRHKNLESAVFLTGLLFFVPWIKFSSDKTILILFFVLFQMTAQSVTLVIFILRITGLFKNKNAWLYFWLGIVQIFLLFTDLILIMTGQIATKTGTCLFTGLNALFAFLIFRDIYQNPDMKQKS